MRVETASKTSWSLMDPNVLPDGHSFKGCYKSDFRGINFKGKIAIVAHGDCLVRLEIIISINNFPTKNFKYRGLKLRGLSSNQRIGFD